MKKQWITGLLIAFLILSMACSFSRKNDNEPSPPKEKDNPQEQPAAGSVPSNPSGSSSQSGGTEISQWAIDAQASTEYGSDSWSARQATGSPDTLNCEDQVTAWASATSNGVDWLELTYETPVTPTELHIHQNYSPSQVTEVIAYDTQGSAYTVYQADPKQVNDCPYVLSIPIKEAKYQTQRIRILIDQSRLGTSWNEIDAVELVGIAAPGAQSAAPSSSGNASSSTGSSQASVDGPRFFYDELDGPLSDLWIDDVFYYTDEEDPDAEPVYTIEQERGKLKFYLETPWQYVYYFYTPQTYRNVRIDYEIENKGVNSNNIGLVCRFSDYGYYEFIATSGGYYSIMRYYEDGDKELATGGIKSIRFGTEKKNVFTAICDEDYLYFIVNDVEIAKVYDDEIAEGLVGINVSAEDVVPVQVEIEWIEISEP